MGSPGRRTFLTAGATLTAGALLVDGRAASAAASSESDINIVGPKEGYSPQIGTLVSMMAWMRQQVLRSVKGLAVADLDLLLDGKANTIGAMLLHLAATETFYQQHTFDGHQWGEWPKAVREKWGTAAELGDAGRKGIKGNSLDYYVSALTETRERTLAELRKRDDAWLMAVDKDWPWGPTDNYCKWFHVCEHESNHNGQIKLVKGRLPRAKPGGE